MKEEFAITIPSKARPELIKEKTLKLLEGMKNVFVFVEPQDYEQYKNSLTKDTVVVKLDKNDMGVNYSRKFIQKYFLDKDVRYVWQLDDNLDQFIMREGTTPGGFPKLVKVQDVKRMFEEVFAIMINHKYMQVTLSFRPTNWCHLELVKEKTRAWGIVLNDVEEMASNGIFYDEKCMLFGDYDLTAQILKGGFTNACFYKYAFHKKMAHHEGGCQTYRSKELSEKMCNYLQKKYGSMIEIKFVERHNIFEPFFKWDKVCFSISPNQKTLLEFKGGGVKK